MPTSALSVTEKQVEDGMRAAALKLGASNYATLKKPNHIYAIPMVPLSFAFTEASFPGNATVDTIIKTVRAALIHRFRRQDPLSYAEVADQMFDWLSKMEATNSVFCVNFS